MTISSSNRKAGPYTGTGLVTSYPFSFKVFQASDLLVQQTDTNGGITTLVLTTNYTVTLNSDQDGNPGGTVVLNVALPTGYQLVIGSQVQQLQSTLITNNGGFYPKVITDALDKLTILIQQQQQTLNNSLQLPFAVSGINAVLPTPVGDSVLAWNVAGNAMVNGPTTGAIAAAASNAASAAASAASALSSLNTFKGQYYGALPADPSLDPLGNAPTAGDLYFNTSTNTMRTYNGSAWQDVAQGVSTPYQLLSGNGSTTNFTLSSAPGSLGSLEVFISGVRQRPTTDYTLSGTTLTFTTAPAAGTSNIFCRWITTQAINVPADGSVTAAKMAAGAAVGNLGYTPVNKAGDSGIGPLALVSDPVNPLEASTKQYVDSAGVQVQSISASVASNALTVNWTAKPIDFRSATLSDGTVNRRLPSGTLSLTVPSGSTLGTVNNQAARLAILAIDNAGTVEVAVVNLASGVNLDETTLISTVAANTAASFTGSIAVTTGVLTVSAMTSGTITTGMAINSGAPQGTVITAQLSGTAGGVGTYQTNYYAAVASTAMTGVAGYGIYSNTARSNVAFRVVGFIDITETTAGTWASGPTRIQGAGGLSASGWNSLGYGQTWQNLTGSRAFGTTYYNTTGRPIFINVVGTTNSGASINMTINNIAINGAGTAANSNLNVSAVIPPGASYSVAVSAGSPSMIGWQELR